MKGVFWVMHLITGHLDTDFDSLASMVAVQKLYPDAVICPPGSPDRKVKDFMSRHAHQWPLSKPKRIPLDQVTLMVVVDTRNRQRIGPFAALDEYNLIRFADLAKEYSQTIQLIVMTHRRTTMERADLIYGVTMVEPGSSKIVGIDVENYL